MKNLLESVAILFVGLLSVAIIFLIVQYNLIDDNIDIDEVSLEIPQKKVTKKEKTNAYLDSLEGYGDDVDVKVDATKEDNTNEVVVESELNKDDLDVVVQDKAKTSYMQNLENYSNSDKKIEKEPAKPAQKISSEPEKLEEDPDAGAVGMAIDALFDDEPAEASNKAVHAPKEIGENAEVVDEIGMAIDAALDNL